MAVRVWATITVSLGVVAALSTFQGSPATAARGEPSALFEAGLVPEGRASSGTYGRDSNEVLFVLWPDPAVPGAKPQIMVTRRTTTGWTRPMPAFEHSNHFVAGPSVIGDVLFFETNRRDSADGREDTDIWTASRVGESWANAKPIGAPFDTRSNEHNVTVSKRQTICFNSSREEGLGGNDIYCAVRRGDGWASPTNLGPNVNSASTDGAAHLDLDERFLVFGSDRPGGHGGDDLYISINRKGRWEQAVNLGPSVNTRLGEWAPAVSPDGTKLLFSREIKRGHYVMYEMPFDSQWIAEK